MYGAGKVATTLSNVSAGKGLPEAARQPRGGNALADESAAGEVSHLGGFFQSNGEQAEVQKDAL